MIARLLPPLVFCGVLFFLLFLQQIFSIIAETARVEVLVVAALFCSIIFRYQWALTLGVFGGVFFDVLEPARGGVSVALVVSLIITNYLFIHFFTNRSLWTLLLLGGIGTMLVAVGQAIFRGSFTLFLPTFTVQIVAHTVLFIVLFFFINAITARLKPYILVRE